MQVEIGRISAESIRTMAQLKQSLAGIAFGRPRPKLAEFGPNSAEIAEQLAKAWAESRLLWLNRRNVSDRNSAAPASTGSSNPRQIRPKSAKMRPKSPNMWPKSPNMWPKPAESSQIRLMSRKAGRDRRWPRNRELSQLSAQHGRENEVDH